MKRTSPRVRINSKGYPEAHFQVNNIEKHRTYSKSLTLEEVQKLADTEYYNLLYNKHNLVNPNYTLSQLVNDAIKYIKTRYADPDKNIYHLQKFLKIIGDKKVSSITLEDVEKYRNIRKNAINTNNPKKIIQPSTINRELNTVQGAFSYAISCKKISNNPFDGLKKLRINNPTKRFLTLDEEKQLLKVCSKNLQNMIIFAIYSGLRLTELCSLQWADIYLNEGYFLARDTKNNKVREVPLIPKHIEILNSIERKSKYVFTSSRTRTKYKDPTSTFESAVERSGIPHITWHELRHTTASRLNELGVEITVIQRILGHASIVTTLNYIHNNDFAIKNAMQKLNNYDKK